MMKVCPKPYWVLTAPLTHRPIIPGIYSVSAMKKMDDDVRNKDFIGRWPEFSSWEWEWGKFWLHA